MIYNNVHNNMSSVNAEDIKKLSAPIEKLSNIRHSLVFIYPAIITDSLGGTTEEKLIRKFFAISMLKEIEISNILSNIDELLNAADKINTDIPRSRDEIINYINPDEASKKFKSTSTAFLAYQILKDVKTDIKTNSKELSKRLKEIIEKDPYYQQYQSVIAFKEVNDVKVPIVIGTKNFQVNDAALYVILITALTLNLKLDSLADISRIEKVLNTKTVSQLLQLFGNMPFDPETYTNRIKDIYQKLFGTPSVRPVYSRNKAMQIIKGMFTALSFIYHPFVRKKITNTNTEIVDYYFKLTTSDLKNALTAFKLSTNIHYYSKQLNDRFSGIVVETLQSIFLKEYNEFISTFFNQIINDNYVSPTSNNQTFNNTIATIISVLSALKTNILNRLINNLQTYKCDNNCYEKLTEFIIDNVDKLDTLYDILTELDKKIQQTHIDLIGFHVELLDRIKNDLDKLFMSRMINIKQKVSELYPQDNDESLVDLVQVVYIIINSIKQTILNVINKIITSNEIHKDIEEILKKYNLNIDELSSFELSDKPEKIVKDVIEYLDAGFLYKNKQVRDLIDTLIIPVIDELIKSEFRSGTNIINEYRKFSEEYINSLVLNVFTINPVIYKKATTDPDISKQLNKTINELKNKVAPIIIEDIEKVIKRQLTVIIFAILTKLLELFIKYTNVKQYTFDSKNLNLEFPNYMILIPEEILRLISSIGIIYRPDILQRISFDDLEPKKILNPIDFNPKYATEFLVRELKIPSIFVTTSNGKSVIYKTLYMTKPEKTSIDKIKEFVKLYSVVID